MSRMQFDEPVDEHQLVDELVQDVRPLESITLAASETPTRGIRLYFYAGEDRPAIMGARTVTVSQAELQAIDDEQASWLANSLGREPDSFRTMAVLICMKHQVPIGWDGCDCD